jgi:hypothetical protein
MSDTDTPAQEATEAPQDGQAPKATEPKTFDEGYVKTLRQEAARYRTEAQQAKEKVSEFEEANQSEMEKLTNRNTSLADESKKLSVENARLRVAIEKQVPGDLVDRLRGDTQEEMAADADKLLGLLNQSGEEPTPDFDGGARESAPEPKTPEAQHDDVVMKLLGLTPN